MHSVLVYHSISTPVEPLLADADISPARFESQLRWLSRWRRVVPLAETLRASAPRNLVAITFDDGYRDNLSVALPLLERFQLPMTLFVTAGFLGRDAYLSESELKEISRHPLVTIGAHGLWHRHFNRLPTADARFELIESRRLLASITGKSIDLLAWPFGECNEALEQLSADCGYRASWSVWKGTNSAHSRWRVPLGRQDNLARFVIKASGVYALTKAKWNRRGVNDYLECADLSALCPDATGRGRGVLESTRGERRQVAVGQSGD
ncbi:MAG TPA: polysaccharide deacetylase family protein [Pyrinomonadaceae bacterium]|nr:polysaccharide deacetylase family protein [Pyrinomonadaceae bacterium]